MPATTAENDNTSSVVSANSHSQRFTKGHRPDEDADNRVRGRERRQRCVQRPGLERALGQDHAGHAGTGQKVGLPALEQVGDPEGQQMSAALGQRRTGPVDDPAGRAVGHRLPPRGAPATEGHQGAR